MERCLGEETLKQRKECSKVNPKYMVQESQAASVAMDRGEGSWRGLAGCRYGVLVSTIRRARSSSAQL